MTSTHQQPEVVSLFSGAGGLDIGLERAGWKTVTATDLMPDAMETLRQSQSKKIAIPGGAHTFLEGTRLLEADIKVLSRADLIPEGAGDAWRPDLLVGGPPCQPWSSAGAQRGLLDPRGQLIAHMLRLIGETKPKFVLFENVRGLVTASGATGSPGEVLRSIQKDLDDLGFASQIATINAANYGAAQRRVRLILVASSDHELPGYPLPTHDRHGVEGRPWRSLDSVISALGPATAEDIVRPSGDRAEELRALKPGTGIRTGGKVMNNRPGGHWGYRQDSFLADLTLPSRTVRAASTPDWVRVGTDDLRRLTWRECAALQGFPSSWEFSGSVTSRFTQIGNAVQTDMGEAMGRHLMAALQLGPSAQVPVTPPWPSDLLKRVKYTESEHKVNGELRVRLTGRASA